MYEIFVNTVPGMCTANNYCPVDIWDYGNSPYQTYEYASSWPHSLPTCNGVTPCGNLVGTVGRVWCDQACQQLGIACSSINSAIINGISAVPTKFCHSLPGELCRHSAAFQLLHKRGRPPWSSLSELGERVRKLFIGSTQCERQPECVGAVSRPAPALVDQWTFTALRTT